jgi:hypothetical protein
VVWYAARKSRLSGGIPISWAQRQTIGTGLGSAGNLRALNTVSLQAGKDRGQLLQRTMQQ